MKLIALSGSRGNGQYAAVSDEDFAYMSQWAWHLNSEGYARRTQRKDARNESVYMHREVARRIGMSDSMYVDHLNGDKLDNCRHSLREATCSQNAINSVVWRNNKSGAKGVHWSRSINRYVSQIQVSGRRIYLGSFVTIEEARSAREAASIKHFGEFVRDE